jgi:hypothetical protein
MLKNTVFWNVERYSLVDVIRRFHLQGGIYDEQKRRVSQFLPVKSEKL